jgi:DNA-binding MarR family transcriptional regulator
MKTGPVDVMIDQWANERPDLDSSSLGVLARISRLARVAEENADKVLNRFDLSGVEFHLLAAIRTAPDHRPSPRDLLGPLMVSSGGLTNRIDRLEKANLVERIANPEDRRGVLLQLTEKGRGVVDKVTTEYLANQNQVLDDALAEGERETLSRLLRKLLASMVEAGGDRSPGSAPIPDRIASA